MGNGSAVRRRCTRQQSKNTKSLVLCFANAHSNINIDFGVKMINHQSQTKITTASQKKQHCIIS
jgi:hypothetical protein